MQVFLGAVVGGPIPKTGNCDFSGFDGDAQLPQLRCKTKRILGEKAAERYALRASYFMSELKAPTPLSGIQAPAAVRHGESSSVCRRDLRGETSKGLTSKPGPFKHRRDPAPREFQSCFKRSPVPRGRVFRPPKLPLTDKSPLQTLILIRALVVRLSDINLQLE